MANPKREQIEHIKANAVQISKHGVDDPGVITALCDLAIRGLEMTPRPIDRPRRKIVMLGKFEADNWEALASTFQSLEIQALREGGLSTRSVSGGYSTGYIYVCDVDGNMTHDKWAEDLDAYLSSLPETRP